MDKRNMEIDESLLDEEDGDDISIRGRESISSLFVRACGIGPEDVFEDQQCDNTPSSTAHMPLAKSVSLTLITWRARLAGTGCSQSVWVELAPTLGNLEMGRVALALAPLRLRGTAGSWKSKTFTGLVTS